MVNKVSMDVSRQYAAIALRLASIASTAVVGELIVALMKAEVLSEAEAARALKRATAAISKQIPKAARNDPIMLALRDHVKSLRGLVRQRRRA